MTVSTGHRTGIARAVMGALLLPFLLLSLFASGTMLARSSDSVAIVICIGDTLVTRYVPADQAPPGDAPAPHADSCAWDEVLRTALPVLPAVLAAAPKALAAVRFGPGGARDATVAAPRRGTIRAPPQAA